jgi:hypothetical protein
MRVSHVAALVLVTASTLAARPGSALRAPETPAK